jgi:hypothetical protein
LCASRSATTPKKGVVEVDPLTALVILALLGIVLELVSQQR